MKSIAWRERRIYHALLHDIVRASDGCLNDAMNSVLLDAVSVLGQAASAAKVQDLVERLSAVERYDDPPFRHYLSTSRDGVSLLFEDDRLVDVQVFVEATKTKASCPLALPFGLRRGMRQADVHRAVGEPTSSDEIDSRYHLYTHRARLLGAYDQTGLLKYLSFAPISRAL